MRLPVDHTELQKLSTLSTELGHLDGLASSAAEMVTSSNHSFKDIGNNTIVGWIDPSKDRSTLDIIYSSIITIVLCVWISTYPNVPAPRDRLHHWIIDKFNLAMIGFLGPDLLFALALGQWSSARRSVKARLYPNPESTSLSH